MRRRRITLLLLVGILLVCAKSYAGFPGCLWEGVKTIVSAPVNAVGWVLGQGANQVVDPALDNAFSRIRTASDHALDRFDQLSASRIDQFDKVSKTRLEQLDKIAENRIGQIDEVMKRRIDQVDEILGRELKQVETIGAALIEKEAQVLDTNVTRMDDILNRGLDRLQNLETDALDRLEGAVQDQVPFAAGQVARTMEWTVAVIVFVVVLVGFGGVELLRRGWSAPADASLLTRVKAGLNAVPRILLPVGIPMVVLFGIVQTGYWIYCNRSDAGRVARLDDAAQLLGRGFQRCQCLQKTNVRFEQHPKDSFSDFTK
jgi:hypothetical protein